MKFTRTMTIALGIGVAAIGLIAYAMRPKSLAVDTAVVNRGPMESTVDADGRTRVRNRYVVVAPVAGRLQRLAYVEGASVKAGDVVARLAPMPLDAQTVAQARSRVDAAVAIATEAATQVRTAEAALEQRRRELSRAHRLADVGGVSPREVEESELAVTQADNVARGAVQRANAANADVRQARAALMGVENSAAELMLVRAPVAGRVLRVPERSERIVAAGTPLVEIGDPASLEVVIDVLSSDGATIHPGDAVRLAEWSGANGESATAVKAHVREVEPSAFTKVSALGVEEQRVNVIVDLEGVPPSVGDGFRVEASIVIWATPNALRLPRSALVREATAAPGGGGWSVFVVRNGRTERRALRIGHVGGTLAEVLDGVDEGAEVVLFPSDRVTPGTRVSARRG